LFAHKELLEFCLQLAIFYMKCTKEMD